MTQLFYHDTITTASFYDMTPSVPVSYATMSMSRPVSSHVTMTLSPLSSCDMTMSPPVSSYTTASPPISSYDITLYHLII